MAPMALSDSKLYETEFKAATYKRNLAIVEDQLVTFRKNEILFNEEIAVLKREKFDSASKSLGKLLESQITDKSKKDLGYHDVPPPHPLIYNAPTKLDLSNSGLEEFQHLEFEGYEPKDSKNVSIGAPIIEDWESDSDDEKKPKSKVEKKTGVSKTVSPTVSKIEFVRPKQQEKPVRKPVKYAEMYSFDHLQYTCKQKRQLNGQREKKPVWNNARRVNHQDSSRITQPNPKRHMVPRKILTRSSPISLNTARQSYLNVVCCCCSRQVNTARPKAVVNVVRTN
ncbi:hypothetical protein Tco_1043084 [Tanacetum coccineum]|uniref:Uncharacterized protein n=1 Tax=Tanacetum coccineum TaxID=301880 RepID=A0ABQ5GLM3_9ASTR